jgi:hypothetical protein
VRVAERDYRLVGHDHGRERALQPGHDVRDGILDAGCFMAGEQRRDDLRVRCGAERNLPIAQLAVQLDGIDQVAVVGERQRAGVVAYHRLRVLPLRGAGGRVADVADRHVAEQRAQGVLVEDLGHQSLVANGHDVARSGRGGDARRLLAAVL